MKIKYFPDDPAKFIIPEEEKNQIMKEIEEIIETIPYNLHVALIKVAQLNQYTPLSIEKYYECIKPTFHLLRRTDGSKYKSSSMNTLRAGMFSSKLFYRDANGLFMLNFRNAINELKLLQKRKVLNKTESKKEQTEPTEKEEKLDEKETKNYDEFFGFDSEQEKNINKLKSMLGKKTKNDNFVFN